MRTPTRIEREEQLVQYLLGGLATEEREEIESRILTEDGFHESVSATADDLSAAYLNGELSADQRARFETHFLASPRQRERLAFVRDVVSVIDELPAPATAPAGASWRMWASAAALVLAVVAGALRLLPDRNQPPQVRISPSPAVAPRASPPDGPSPPPMRGAVEVVRLPHTPSAPAASVAVSAQTKTVRLEVPVPAAGPPSYEAVIRTSGGTQVWRADDLAPARGGEPVVIEIPAGVLGGDDYQLTLEGEGVRDASGAARVVSRRFSLHVQHR